jgi:ABC-type antimicrobial peptide transport system permease subunit
LTVILVIVGVVGTVSYGISRRRREIGVRLALGAARLEVTGAMMRGTLVPVAAGLGVGIAAAFSLGRLMSSFLYGVEPTDIVPFTVAVTVIAAVAGVASFVPAWRAAGINPAEVLNAD